MCKSAVLFVGAILLSACGGGGGSGDGSSSGTTTANVSSPILGGLRSDCGQLIDSEGNPQSSWVVSEYTVESSGNIVVNNKIYDDANCVGNTSISERPVNFTLTTKDIAAEVTQEGLDGYRMSVSVVTDFPTGENEYLYIIQSDRLCTSYSFQMGSGYIGSSGSASYAIDFSNCLSRI